MAPWAAVRQWAKTVPIRLHVKHRHFRQTHKHTQDIVDVYTHTFTLRHTVSEGRCVSACQKHSGNERSAGAVGNTRERVPALHPLLSLLFSPLCSLLPPAPPLCYLTAPPLAFHSHLFLCFALCLSLWICLLFFCTPISCSPFPPLIFPWLLLFPLFSPSLSSSAEIYRDFQAMLV